MEDDVQQEQSDGQLHPTEEVPMPSFGLASLLDDEQFLLMVFEHLVEHGLQNCRLVCRRWYATCKKFPVELRYVKAENPEMFDAFPNATSVYLQCSPGMPVAELFGRLSSLNDLKAFAFESYNASCDGSAQLYFQSVIQLTDLFIFNGSSGLPDNLIASMKYLTNLTKLHFHASPPKRRLDPFVELQKIRDLDVNIFTLFNKNEAIMFPSLTNLAGLSFGGIQTRGEPLLNSLKAIDIYASTLKRLLLSSGSYPDTPVDYTPLRSLTNLESLLLCYTGSYSQGLVEVLPQLRKLTSLVMSYYGTLDAAMRKSIARCTSLKALKCRNIIVLDKSEEDLSFIPYLTHLTEIAFHHYENPLTDLSCLTLLQRLRLRVVPKEDCSLDEALECMHRLQIIDVGLVVDNVSMFGQLCGGLRLSGSALSAMRHLKSVSLRNVDVDESFFHALASNAELTKLEFISYRRRGQAQNFVQQVNLLRNLEELTLDVQENFNFCDLLLPEDLSRLKRLNIGSNGNEVDAVCRKFNQSLRRVLVNEERESAWCSRSTV